MMLHCAQADHLLPCVWMHPSQTCNLQVGYLEAPIAQFVSPRLDDNSCRLGAIETLHDPRYYHDAVLQPEPAWGVWCCIMMTPGTMCPPSPLLLYYIGLPIATSLSACPFARALSFRRTKTIQIIFGRWPSRATRTVACC